MSRSDEELIAIGAIMRPHGVRGEVRVKLFNPDSDLIFDVKRFVARDKAGVVLRTLDVQSVRPEKADHALMIFVGVNDRDGSDALRSVELCVPRSALPPLEEGEYYFVDLVGLTARLPSGDEVGKVLRIQEYPASACLVIEKATGGELEVPLVEPYFLRADISGGWLEVDRLEDLL